ncbi:hypothetical protein G5V59_18270 [Nocardioides sp. W3-2-3]|uniref:hypothetical protein n=1 Tax=Nocardioides convexus TaxID=2712224 RepID=UPI002418AB91|nr:hypothetical protein [Nocardioides convexus]NHA01150.1 hypothetical protein [Nocardioides convexus]
MSHPYEPRQDRAAFQGWWMAPGAPGGVPAWVIVEDGRLALMVPGASASGFVDVFRVPLRQARVSSAAQRITVTVGGTSYPVLARPHGALLGPVAGVVGSAGRLAGHPTAGIGSTAFRAGNLAADSSAFARQGGHELPRGRTTRGRTGAPGRLRRTPRRRHGGRPAAGPARDGRDGRRAGVSVMALRRVRVRRPRPASRPARTR